MSSLSLVSGLYIFLPSYYINHYTKTTTWEDPRERYQQIGKGSIKVMSGSVWTGNDFS